MEQLCSETKCSRKGFLQPIQHWDLILVPQDTAMAHRLANMSSTPLPHLEVCWKSNFMSLRNAVYSQKCHQKPCIRFPLAEFWRKLLLPHDAAYEVRVDMLLIHFLLSKPKPSPWNQHAEHTEFGSTIFPLALHSQSPLQSLTLCQV